MTTARDIEQSWPSTVFDTDEWLDAWAKATIDKRQVLRPTGPARYLLSHSPLWQGYEDETEVERVWDRPVLAIGSVYAVYGPGYLAPDPHAVATLVDDAMTEARDVGAAGVLVFNLPPGPARQWAVTREPDVFARLDTSYYKNPGSGPDPVLGEVKKRVRTEWRRRWRRATEKGARLVEETGAAAIAHIPRILELTNGSATKHGYPELYDEQTLAAVLSTPHASLIRAEWEGQSIGAFVALEHNRRLYLWAGGTDANVYHEVSPYLFMLYEILAMGVERGWDIIEFGRGNDDFKRRHGFGGIHLWSLWYATEPGDKDVYGRRLTALHDGMARVAGYPELGHRP